MTVPQVVAQDLMPVPTVASMGALEDAFAPAPADALAGGPLPTGAVPAPLLATATG